MERKASQKPNNKLNYDFPSVVLLYMYDENYGKDCHKMIIPIPERPWEAGTYQGQGTLRLDGDYRS
jgi:hypothetical protein